MNTSHLRNPISVLVAAGLLFAPLGCLFDSQRREMSLLGERLRPKTIEPGPDGLFMDFIYLERPFGDSQLNGELWWSADDAVIDIGTRQKLEQHGFRVAVLGGQLPAILGLIFEEAELRDDRGQHLQLHSGTATQVQTSSQHERWFVAAMGSTPAAEYADAVGGVHAVPHITPDGLVTLSITPEIEYGEPRREFVPNRDFGTLDWAIKIGRHTRSFTELQFNTKLRSSQFLMLSCQPGGTDTLGGRFFTRIKDGRPMQRVVLIKAEPSRQALAARGKS